MCCNNFRGGGLFEKRGENCGGIWVDSGGRFMLIKLSIMYVSIVKYFCRIGRWLIFIDFSGIVFLFRL